MKIHPGIKILICLIMVNTLQLIRSKAQEHSPLPQIATATENLKKAMIDADSVMLDRLTADSLSYGHSGGMVQNKEQFIKSITSKASVFITIEFTAQKITIVGRTALVRHVLSASTNDAGKGPGTVKLAILEVWIKNKASWQLLARQAVKVT